MLMFSPFRPFALCGPLSGRAFSFCQRLYAPLFSLVIAFAGATLPPTVRAHDVPGDIKVQMYVKPAGDRLQLLVRVPLAAMREVDVPQRGPGYLDLARAEPALRNAATLWIADNVEVYEGATRLAQPSLAAVRVTLPSDKSF